MFSSDLVSLVLVVPPARTFLDGEYDSGDSNSCLIYSWALIVVRRTDCAKGLKAVWIRLSWGLGAAAERLTVPCQSLVGASQHGFQHTTETSQHVVPLLFSLSNAGR